MAKYFIYFFRGSESNSGVARYLLYRGHCCLQENLEVNEAETYGRYHEAGDTWLDALRCVPASQSAAFLEVAICERATSTLSSLATRRP